MHLRESGGKEKRVRAELNIEGMNDDASAVQVRSALEDVAGVRNVDVTSQRKTAIVEFDEQTVQQNTLLKIIQDLGFEATIAGDSQSGVGA